MMNDAFCIIWPLGIEHMDFSDANMVYLNLVQCVNGINFHWFYGFIFKFNSVFKDSLFEVMGINYFH